MANKNQKEAEVVKTPVSSLVIDPENLRNHTDEEIDLIAKSIIEFGQIKPIIAEKNTNVVKIGNGRLLAMKKIGMTECDCIFLDWSNRKGQEVIDNRIGEFSEFSEKDLYDWLEEKKDWWGIDEEMEEIIEKKSSKKEKKENIKKEEKIYFCPCCGKPLVKKNRVFLD